MPSVRPTLRCAQEDSGITIPGLDTPLDEVDHPLVRKANEQFADAARHQEKITSIDDEYLVKVKVQRWRGAVLLEDQVGWLVAAGWREAGSSDDFYETLTAQATAARKSYNAAHSEALKTRTYIADWLPNDDDRQRYLAEEGTRFDRRLQATVDSLLRASLRDGREHRAQPGLFTLGIQVRADQGNETWVAIRITGSVPDGITSTILDLIPGCRDFPWQYRLDMPDRETESGEDVWFNLMDPVEAAKVLNAGGG